MKVSEKNRQKILDTTLDDVVIFFKRGKNWLKAEDF